MKQTTKWFANVGTEIDEDLPRLSSWTDWVGPEKPETFLITQEHQDIYDRRIKGCKEYEIMFDKKIRRVVNEIEKQVGFKPNGDSWDAKTTAKFQAAWTIALVEVLQELKQEVPAVLLTQQKWFLKGHWPCAYAIEDMDKKDKRLVIY